MQEPKDIQRIGIDIDDVEITRNNANNIVTGEVYDFSKIERIDVAYKN